MCAWVPRSGCFLLLRSVSFSSRSQWCHIHLWPPASGWFLLLQSVTFSGFGYFFVSCCAFFCSLILNGATFFWEQGFEFVPLAILWLLQMCLGTVAKAEPGDDLSLGLGGHGSGNWGIHPSGNKAVILYLWPVAVRNRHIWEVWLLWGQDKSWVSVWSGHDLRWAERCPPILFFSYLYAPLSGCFSFLPDREKRLYVLGVIERSFSRVPLSGCFLFLLDRQEKFCVFVCCVCVSCYGVTLTRWLWWDDIDEVTDFEGGINMRQAMSTTFYRFPSLQKRPGSWLLAPQGNPSPICLLFLTHPDWNFNTVKGNNRLLVYLQTLLSGVKPATRWPTN